MRVIDIENIVTNMKDDTRFVLRCEEVFHDKISSAAASILMNKGQKPIVCERFGQDDDGDAPSRIPRKPRRQGLHAQHG